jgi:hypothetical protein
MLHAVCAVLCAPRGNKVILYGSLIEIAQIGAFCKWYVPCLSKYESAPLTPRQCAHADREQLPRAVQLLLVACLCLLNFATSANSAVPSLASTTPSPVWPFFGRDAFNSRHTSAVGPSRAPYIAWYHLTSGAPRLAAAAISSDGMVFSSSQDGYIYKLQAPATGNVGVAVAVSSVAYTELGYSSPGIVYDTNLYIGCTNNFAYELQVQDLLAVGQLDGTGDEPVISSPSVGPDFTLYLGTGNAAQGSVLALSWATTSPKWTFDAHGGVISSPSVGSDGTVYVGTVLGKVYAIDNKGKQKWVQQIGVSFTAQSPSAISAD